MTASTVYIGSGAGFAGDRIDAGLPVVETLARRDGPRYLIFEVMGEYRKGRKSFEQVNHEMAESGN